MSTTIARAYPLEHPADYAADINGHEIPIPKEMHANMEWRQGMLEKAETDPDYREAIRVACANSLLFWVNGFAWTYRQNIIEADGRQHGINPDKDVADLPFITWPVQDALLEDIAYSIKNGQDLLIDKSREMGASWLILTAFHWFWQFHPNMHFGEMSRTEDLVDQIDNPDTLFWKHRYLLQKQPGWLVPSYDDPRLRLVNYDTGSTIIGASTTGDVGQGGRKVAFLIDEAARIRQLEKVDAALADTTSCRLYNSTPSGPSHFSRIKRTGKVRVFILHWSSHPEKGRGRRKVKDPRTGVVKWSAPWYELQLKRRKSKREIAENLDIDHTGSGNVFFDVDVLNRQRMEYAEECYSTGHLRFRQTKTSADLVQATYKRDWQAVRYKASTTRLGPWRFWMDLEEVGVDPNTGDPIYRPPQKWTYVFGIDVAHGTNMSNSVISVFCIETQRKVAEFVSSTLSPDELAKVTAASGIWFGGRGQVAFVVPEINGPGGRFVQKLRRIGYPWIFRRTMEENQSRKKQDKLGWHSTFQSKVDLLEEYRAALASDDYINPSAEAIDEAEQYVWFELGQGVGPATLQSEDGGAKATHGDRVIADGLSLHGSRYAPRQKLAPRAAPVGSPAERLLRSADGERVLEGRLPKR